MTRTFRLLLVAALSCFAVPAILWGQEEETDKDGPHEDIEARERYWFMMRANEQGEIPPNALVKAKEQMDLLRGVSPRVDAGIAQWEWLGPGNIGGRIRAILVHPTSPNTMWIGGASGGIWRTDNGGASWYPLDDFMANMTVTSLAIDPTNTAVLYAGTGEGFTYSLLGSPGRGIRGAGIFKSIDGGATWQQLGSTNDSLFAWVYRLAHHPQHRDTLLAATLKGVALTTDGGTNWTWTFNQVATDVRYHPTTPNLVLLGTGTDLYTSTNGGGSFTQQTTGAPNKLPMNPGRCEVAFAQSDPQMFYVSINRNGGEVWRSTDGGATWSLRNTGTMYLQTQGDYANTIWVDPTNSSLVVVGGLDLYRSINGGSSFTKISDWRNYHNGGSATSAHADQHAIVHLSSYNGGTISTVFFGNDGGIQQATDIHTVSENSGWVNLAHNLGITQFYTGAATSDGSFVVGGAQDNDKLHYRAQWGAQGWRQPTTGDGGFSAIDPVNINRVYGEYVNLKIQRSDNGGQGYGDKINGLTDAGSGGTSLFIAPFILDPSNPNTLYAGGSSIWQTNNNADSWFRIRNPLGDGELCSAMTAIVPGNTPYMWVGYHAGRVSVGVYWGGSWSWSDVGSGVLPSKYVTDIAINPSNYFEAIVTFGGYDTNNVYMTTNLGATWTQLRGSGAFSLPAIQVNAVQYHPQNPDWIYLGTDLGVLASDDHGQTWKNTQLYQNNEGPSNVPATRLFWPNAENMYVATYGRGMFRTRILPNVYVDIANGGFQNGTPPFPYQQIQSAISTAGNGSNIHINPGVYVQTPLTFFRRGKVFAPGGNVYIR
jgi:hypothetical protein